MALLNSPLNFCREPKYVLVSIHNAFEVSFADAIGLPCKELYFMP